MEIEIRPYTTAEKDFLAESMTALQAHLVGLDPEETMLCPSDFGYSYAEQLLAQVKQREGHILIAFRKGMPVGIAVGIVTRQACENSRIEVEGEFLELVVAEDHRGIGIGPRLMQHMETQFRAAGCQVVNVDVFAPNVDARRSYERMGYAERIISLRKRLV